PPGARTAARSPGSNAAAARRAWWWSPISTPDRIRSPGPCPPSRPTIASSGPARGVSSSAPRCWRPARSPPGPSERPPLRRPATPAPPRGSRRWSSPCPTITRRRPRDAGGEARPLSDPIEVRGDRRLGNGAPDLIDLQRSAEDDHRGDRLDGEARRRARVLVDVQLGDLDLPGALGGQRLQDRGDGAAGTAPGRPEIDQHRNGRVLDLLLPAGVGDGDRPAGEDLLFAAAAGRVVAQAGAQDPVGAAARAAGIDDRFFAVVFHLVRYKHDARAVQLASCWGWSRSAASACARFWRPRARRPRRRPSSTGRRRRDAGGNSRRQRGPTSTLSS